MMDCCSTVAEGAGHEPPGICPNHNGGAKHTKIKAHQSIFIFSTICISLRWRLLLHKGDIKFFSPSENPSALSGAFTKWAKAQENAFCCRKGGGIFPRCLSLKAVGAD